jgi:hypothetical protein
MKENMIAKLKLLHEYLFKLFSIKSILQINIVN